MNINDIMLRDIAEAERKERERIGTEADRHEIGDKCGFPWLAVVMWLAVALAALGTAFECGIWYESRRALKADRDFAAWHEQIRREATERARAMSNQELLNATERKGATAADR